MGLLTKPSPRKETSEKRVVQPQTPRTWALHLKLGTSLLALKKSSKQTLDGSLKVPSSSSSSLVGGSRVEEMEVDNNGDDDHVKAEDTDVEKSDGNEKVVEKRRSRSRPSSPIPNLFKSVFGHKSDDSNTKEKEVVLKPVGEKTQTKSRPSSPLPKLLKSLIKPKSVGEENIGGKADEDEKNEPVVLKSFRLGIPSLFPKKKSSKDLLKEDPPVSKETNSGQLHPEPTCVAPSSSAQSHENHENDELPSRNDSSLVLKSFSSVEEVSGTQDVNPLDSSDRNDISTEKTLEKSDSHSFFGTQVSSINFEPAEKGVSEDFFGKGNDGASDEEFSFFGGGKDDGAGDKGNDGDTGEFNFFGKGTDNDAEANDGFFGNGSDGDKDAGFDFFGGGFAKEDDGNGNDNDNFFSFGGGGESKPKDDNPFSFF